MISCISVAVNGYGNLNSHNQSRTASVQEREEQEPTCKPQLHPPNPRGQQRPQPTQHAAAPTPQDEPVHNQQPQPARRRPRGQHAHVHLPPHPRPTQPVSQPAALDRPAPPAPPSPSRSAPVPRDKRLLRRRAPIEPLALVVLVLRLRRAARPLVRRAGPRAREVDQRDRRRGVLRVGGAPRGAQQARGAAEHGGVGIERAVGVTVVVVVVVRRRRGRGGGAGEAVGRAFRGGCGDFGLAVAELTGVWRCVRDGGIVGGW